MTHVVVLIERVFDDELHQDEAYIGKWHARTIKDDPRVLCDGLAYEDSESVFKLKTVKRGGITCEECLDTIKYYKSIKL